MPAKVSLVKAMVFPVVMYGCENWTIKEAEHRRIDAFELWCWRRLLTVRCMQGDQTSQFLRKSVLDVHQNNWSWSWSSNTLATRCEELTHWKRPWCWERLKAVGEGDDRGWNGWMASLTQWTWVCMSSGSWWWTGRSGVLQSMGLQSQTRLRDWTDWYWGLFTQAGAHSLTVWWLPYWHPEFKSVWSLSVWSCYYLIIRSYDLLDLSSNFHIPFLALI